MDEKQLTKELLPYFIGLRNDLKAIGDKLNTLNDKQPPEITKAEVLNFPEQVREVSVINQIQEIAITNPVKAVEIIGLPEFAEKLYTALNQQGIDIPKSIGGLQELIRTQLVPLGDKTFKVEVLNQKDTKFPSVQKVEITNPIPPPKAFRITNSEPDEAIPVILTDKTGMKFYDALSTMIGTFTDIDLSRTNKLLADINKNIEDLEINIGDVNVNMDDLEALNGANPFHSYDTADIVGNFETDLVTYTVPTGKKARIKVIHATGGSDCELTLKIGNNVVHKSRSAWNDRNISSNFEGLEATAGQVVKITILHNETPNQTFYGDIDGILL